MRFAFAGCDRDLSLFKALIAEEWEPVQLFSVPEINHLSTNKDLLALAQAKKISIQLSRMNEHDLVGLREMQCDILVVGSYNWRIPEWKNYLSYAINFHPAPLPLGRGPYPIVNAILQSHKIWAVTCHKIAPDFDTGEILDSEVFPLLPHEIHDSLEIKIQIAKSKLASRIAKNFPALWQDAQIQTAGEYWPLFKDEDKTIDFAQPVYNIDRQLRAFGPIECIARINDNKILIKAGYVWPEPHSHVPGQVIHVSGKTVVIACKDGFLAVTDWYSV